MEDILSSVADEKPLPCVWKAFCLQVLEFLEKARNMNDTARTDEVMRAGV